MKLVYIETFDRIDKAFYREKQIQGWSHKKKRALIENRLNELHPLSECKNKTHFKIYRSLSVVEVSEKLSSPGQRRQ